MANRTLDYLIKLVPDTSEFTKIRDKIKKIDMGEFIQFTPTEAKKLKNILDREVNDVGAQAGNIGKKLQEGLTKGLDATKLQELVNLDTAKLKETMELVGQLTDLISKHSSSDSWLKDGKGFLDSLTGSEQKLSALEASIGALETKFDGLDDMLTSTIAKFDVLEQRINGLRGSNGNSNNAINQIVQAGEKTINVFARMDSVLQSKGGLEKQKAQLEELYDLLSTDVDAKFPDFSKMSVEQLLQQAEELDKKWDEIDAKSNFGKYTAQQEAEVAKIMGQLIKIDKLLPNGKKILTPVELGGQQYGASVEDYQKDIQAVVDKVKQSLDELDTQIKQSLGDTLSKTISEQLSEIKLNLSLDKEHTEKLVGEINQYVAEINKSPLDTIKVRLDDLNPANVIEDKTKRGYKDKPADDDVATTELVNKTASRFEKISEIIEKKQEGILNKTKEWREKMVKQLKFSNGDFEFNFGDSLFESLQRYLTEQGNELKFVVDQETIKEQLKMVVENSGLTLGGLTGGTTTIDADSIAKAVYDGMMAFVNGQPAPSSRSNDTVSVDSAKSTNNNNDEDADQYVKKITENTIHSDRVIEALRDFAKASTKNGAGRQNVARWLTDRGINIDAINNGASDDVVRKMLNTALMKKDKFGYARGATIADILSDLKRFGITGGKQAEDVNALKREIVEMLSRMGIDQEYWQESQRRYQSYESYEFASQYGRPIAALNKARRPLYENSMKDFAGGGYKRLTDDKYIDNLDASVAYIDALESEHLQSANQAIDAAQQKASKLKEEIIELEKQSVDAKDKLDKAKAEYDRLNSIPEEQRTSKEKAEIIKAQKELNTASNQYSWVKRDSRDKKKEYLRLVTYTDQAGNRHVGTIDQLKERRDAQQAIYADAKSQITSFKDAIIGLGENPAAEAVSALEQVARNFFEQSRNMLQNLFKHYGDSDTFQGRVTLQNGRTVDIKSPYDFLGFKDEDVADVDVYEDIMMKRWERSRSVKKSVPQDFERPNYYVNRPKPPLDIENERVENQAFSPIDAPKDSNIPNAIRMVESRVQQFSEEKAKVKNEVKELDEVIKSKEQELASISELVGALTEAERATLTKDAEKAQKKIIEKQGKRQHEQQAIADIDAEIFRTESMMSAVSQLDVNAQLDERNNNLTNRIHSLLAEKDNLANYHATAYDAYNEAITKHEEAKKAYDDYIEKLVNEALLEKSQSGEIKQMAEERGIGELEAIDILRKDLFRQFDYSGRADISALRQAETETRFAKSEKEEAYKNIKGKMDNIDTLVSQLEQERANLTVEALQAEKEAALLRHKNALAELRRQKKLAEARLSRAQRAEQEAYGVLDNNIILQQKEKERELDALRGQRSRLSGEVESADSQLAANQRAAERLRLQEQYNQLKEKELMLQREIEQLEDGDIKASKQSELDSMIAELKELESQITSLGGSVTWTTEREYTDADKKSDALRQAVEIQNRLMIAKAQKRAYEKDVADIEKLEQNVRTGGLTSTIGAKELGKFKFAAATDFKNSEYYKDVRSKKKENLEKELDQYTKEQAASIQTKIQEIEDDIRDQVVFKVLGKKNIDLKALRESGGQAAVDKEVKKIAGDKASEIKRKQDAAVEEFRHSDDFQRMSDEATANIEKRKRELWDALDKEMRALVDGYIKSLDVSKGKVIISAADKENIAIDELVNAEMARRGSEVEHYAKNQNVSVEEARNIIEQEVRRNIHQQYQSVFGDFIKQSEYPLSDANEVDLKQFILDRLAQRKAIAKGEYAGDSEALKEKQAYIQSLPAIINSLEESLGQALSYGGFTRSDLANNDLLEEIIDKTANIQLNKTKRQDKEQELNHAIDELESAKKQNLDTKSFKDNVKSIKDEIAALDELILKEEAEVENAKQLIDLRAEEKAASAPILSDQLVEAEERLRQSKEKLAVVKNEIAELENTVRDTEAQYGKDSAEAERARLNLLYKQRAQTSLERSIGWDEKKVARLSSKVATADTDTAVADAADSSKGGLLGRLFGGDLFDGTGLATEDTLQQILQAITGGKVVAQDPEVAAKRARIAEIDKELGISDKKVRSGGASKKDKAPKKDDPDYILNARDFDKNELKNLNTQDELSVVAKKLVADIENAKEGTKEAIELQLKLQKVVNRSGKLYQKDSGQKPKTEDIGKLLGIGDKVGLRLNEKNAIKVAGQGLVESEKQLSNEKKKTAETAKQVDNAKKETESRPLLDSNKKEIAAGTAISDLKSGQKEEYAKYISHSVGTYKTSDAIFADKNAVQARVTELQNVIATSAKDSEEYLKAIVEMSRLISAWRTVVKKTNPEVKDNDKWKEYLTSGDGKLFDNPDDVPLGGISSRSKVTLKQTALSLGTKMSADATNALAVAQQTADAKEREAVAEEKITEEKKERKVVDTTKDAGVAANKDREASLRAEKARLEEELKDAKAVETSDDGIVGVLKSILDAVEQIRTNGVPKGGSASHGSSSGRATGQSKTFHLTEMDAVEKQRAQMIATFGDGLFGENQNIQAVNEYNAAYTKLVEAYKAGNKEQEESLRLSAMRLRAQGKELTKSLTEAEHLEQLVDSSGTYNGMPLSGVYQLSADEVVNLEASMKSYLNTLQLGHIENVKFDNVHKRLAGTLRTSNRTVVDLEMKYNDATRALYLYNKQERESLTGLPAFIKGFKGKIGSILQYTASITSIYRVIGTLRQGLQYIREIDSALTELRKVTDETEESYERFLNTAAKTASKVGSTIKEVVSSTADWARIGYSLKDAATLAESTAVLLNVSEFQSIDEATSALTSTMQAFGYTAEQSMDVVDVMNEVGNNFAVSSDGIATALQDSASSLMAANNSYEQAVALIAAANRVVIFLRHGL